MNPGKPRKPRHWTNILEKFFNVAIVLAAIALTGALIKRQFSSDKSAPGIQLISASKSPPGLSPSLGNAARGPDSASVTPTTTSVKLATDKTGVLIDSDEPFVSEQQLHDAIAAGQHLVVLDVRERTEFGKNHFPQAKNIPVDEIEIRAINELSPTGLIVLFCGCKNDEMSKAAKQILGSQGFTRTTFLHNGSEHCGSCP